MRKTKILAIAPYEGMAELLAAEAKKRPDIELSIQTGNLTEGLRIARTMTAYDSYDAIISRGGTAELIRRELTLPVIEVPLSVYDILRSIKIAENYGEKFAITGFSGITENAKILCDLLQLHITIITFHNQSEVLPELLELRERQFSFVICDQISHMTAQEIGLNSIAVPSGSESIRAALDDASRAVQSIVQSKKQISLLKAALLQIEGRTLIYTARGELIFSSLMGASMETLIDSEIHSSLSKLLNSDGISIEQQIGGQLVKISTHMLSFDGESYTLLRILDRSPLFSEGKNPISIYNDILGQGNPEFGASNSANLIGETQILLEKYASSTLPVLVIGEHGTGKERAAQLLYRLGPFCRRPYYVVDCSLLNNRKLNALLNSDFSPLTEINVTVHLKEVDHLSEEQFQKLCTYIKDSDLFKRNRIIFSLISTAETADKFQLILTNQLSCLLLPIVPLRERTNDMSGIATIYLNPLNVQLNKQIIGLQADALDLVKSYSWPYNLDQFRRVIKELAVITNTSYISAHDVRIVLEQEKKQYPQKKTADQAPTVNLKQPLDKITNDIIHQVLSEENMNREKTAKRLGISRSTLWRILKNS